MDPAHTAVAVMGDLVGSERRADRSRLHVLFNEAVETENRRSEQHLVSPLTITLGDEFQGLTLSMAAGLHLVRRLRLGLLAQGVECRFAMGRVQLASPINRDKAWNMMGPGLAETRERLNAKLSGNAYRFYLGPEGDPLVGRLMEAVGSALTHLELDWTERQRTILPPLLTGDRTVEEISRALKVTPRNVYNIREAGGFDLCRAWWADLEAAASALDRRGGGS